MIQSTGHPVSPEQRYRNAVRKARIRSQRDLRAFIAGEIGVLATSEFERQEIIAALARAYADGQREAARSEARKAVDHIAQVASAVGWQANVGAMETAGMIVSVLHANPEQIGRFLDEGSALFIDGTICQENGSLTHMAISGKVVSPSELRAWRGTGQ